MNRTVDSSSHNSEAKIEVVEGRGEEDRRASPLADSTLKGSLEETEFWCSGAPAEELGRTASGNVRRVPLEMDNQNTGQMLPSMQSMLPSDNIYDCESSTDELYFNNSNDCNHVKTIPEWESVAIDGHKLNMQLDTGSSITIISTKMWRTLVHRLLKQIRDGLRRMMVISVRSQPRGKN